SQGVGAKAPCWRPTTFRTRLDGGRRWPMRRWEHREEIRLVLTSGLLVGNRERSSVDGSLAQRAPRQGKRRTGARGPFSGEACHCVGWPRGSCGRHLVRRTPPPGEVGRAHV